MRSYTLSEKVRAETWVAGERVELAAGPGNVTPKNEGEELLLERLVEARPDIAKVAKAKKAED